MSVSLADIMKLERKLRLLDIVMKPQLIVLRGIQNGPHDNPVQLKYGSNAVTVDREDLAPLLDDEDNSIRWITGTFADFLDDHAGNK